MTAAKSTRIEPQDIGRVAETQSAETVNAYLSLGWIIVGTSSNHYSEHGYSFAYHLGWPRSLGEPKLPPDPMQSFLGGLKGTESPGEKAPWDD